MGQMLTTYSYGVQVVTVEVGKGEDETQFVAHKDLLSKHLEFFRAALGKEWKEGHDNKVHLEEENPEIFKIFQLFLYSGCIYSKKDGDLSDFDESGHGRDGEWRRLSEAWIFGEVILSTSFKDAVVDAIITKIKLTNQDPTGLHTLIYPVSTSKSGIRTLLVDIAVYSWSDVAFQALKSRWPREFFFDVAIAFKKMKNKGWTGEAPYETENTCG